MTDECACMRSKPKIMEAQSALLALNCLSSLVVSVDTAGWCRGMFEVTLHRLVCFALASLVARELDCRVDSPEVKTAMEKALEGFADKVMYHFEDNRREKQQ